MSAAVFHLCRENQISHCHCIPTKKSHEKLLCPAAYHFILLLQCLFTQIMHLTDHQTPRSSNKKHIISPGNVSINARWPEKIGISTPSLLLQTSILPVLQPSNTEHVSQTCVKLFWRTWIISRTIGSLAVFIRPWCCCCIDIQTFRKKTLKYASRFTSFNIDHLNKSHTMFWLFVNFFVIYFRT